MKRGAIWVRVSGDAQDETTQIPDIEQYCAHHGIEIRKRYELHDASAYRGEHQRTLRTMLDDAYRGEFEILVIWALDRIERRGIERVLRLIRELRERNCVLASVKETWLNGSDATTELLVAMFSWMAQQESARRSERIKMGLAERRRKLEAGKTVKGRQAMGGRKPGSKQKKPRVKLSGEAAGWTDERRRAQAERNQAMEWDAGQRQKIAAANEARAALRAAERFARCRNVAYPTRKAASDALPALENMPETGPIPRVWKCDPCKTWHASIPPHLQLDNQPLPLYDQTQSTRTTAHERNNQHGIRHHRHHDLRLPPHRRRLPRQQDRHDRVGRRNPGS